MKRTRSIVIIAVGLLLLLVSAGQLLVLENSLPTADKFNFLERGGDQLAASYYPGENGFGVLLAEGFGSDQTALRILVEAFVREGYHVMTFDFSGHGNSPGGLEFDNAGTDRLALQLIDAMSAFRERAGLDSADILIVGHSLGARVALQAAVLGQDQAAGLLLLGTQVNLVTNLQAEVFTGVSDIDLDWIQALGPTNPQTNVLLVSGSLDDILTPEAAVLLMEKLAGEGALPGKSVGTMESNNWRKLVLVEGVLHNYEIYSAPVIKEVLQSSNQILGWQADGATSAGYSNKRVLSWIGGIAGLFITVLGVNLLLPGRVLDGISSELRLLDARKFFLSKAAFWIPALVTGFLLGGLIFLLPLGNPAFNLIYISFLGGYGILQLILYGTGRMPGVSGKKKLSGKAKWDKRTLFALGFFGLILIGVSFFARTGWFYTLAPNHRLIWAVIFTPITALGGWFGWHENSMISKTESAVGGRLILNTLIGLLPFFFYAGFLAGIGSLSGVVSSLQGLLILFFSILCGLAIQKIGRNIWLSSLCQSFLIYWLILPQGVLFN